MVRKMEKTLYHSFLRVAIVVVAVLVVFDSGILIKESAILSNYTQMHLANVIGVSASVAPNELNQLTSRITELETELEKKERLIAVNVRENNTGTDMSTYILSVILFILLVLIVLNYALDYRRSSNNSSLYEKKGLA